MTVIGVAVEIELCRQTGEIANHFRVIRPVQTILRAMQVISFLHDKLCYEASGSCPLAFGYEIRPKHRLTVNFRCLRLLEPRPFAARIFPDPPAEVWQPKVYPF